MRHTTRFRQRLQSGRTLWVPGAYDAYLTGRFHWHRSGPGGLQTAIAFFDQALRHDPGFGRAHSSRALGFSIVSPRSRAMFMRPCLTHAEASPGFAPMVMTAEGPLGFWRAYARTSSRSA